MKTLECGCDYNESSHSLLSQCTMHAAHMRTHVEASKHPRGTIVDKRLRDKLLVAAIPAACDRVARGHAVEAVATQTESLVHEILRRIA